MPHGPRFAEEPPARSPQGPSCRGRAVGHVILCHGVCRSVHHRNSQAFSGVSCRTLSSSSTCRLRSNWPAPPPRHTSVPQGGHIYPSRVSEVTRFYRPSSRPRSRLRFLSNPGPWRHPQCVRSGYLFEHPSAPKKMPRRCVHCTTNLMTPPASLLEDMAYSSLTWSQLPTHQPNSVYRASCAARTHILRMGWKTLVVEESHANLKGSGTGVKKPRNQGS